MAESELLQMPRPANRPFMASFLDHLIKNGIISPVVGRRAAEVKIRGTGDKRSVLEILHDDFGIARDVLQSQIAQFYAFRMIDMSERAARALPNSEVLRMMRALPERLRSLAMKHKILPFDLADAAHDKLIIVTPNPSGREVPEVARGFAAKKFEICYMTEREWDDFWRAVSNEKGPGRVQATITDVITEADEQDLDNTIDREIAKSQLPALVDKIVADAVRVRAAAIHFVPRRARKTDVYFRVDGTLTHWTGIDDVRVEAVAAAIKLRTPGMDRFERLAPQEGFQVKSADGQLIYLRVASAPITLPNHPGNFEMVVVRIALEPASTWSLETLGLDEVALRAFREVLGMRSGLVVLAGPTDSGVTTTMAAMMRTLLTPSVSALAVGESMEFAFEGVNRIRLTPKLSYESALATIEHHDPDVIILGEIADRRTADLALRLAMKGRHVFARLLASDTAGAVIRLRNFGVEPYMLAQALTLVHAQRLVRRLCPQCRTPRPGNDPRAERLGLRGEEPLLYRPLGCIECVNGYSGRIPLHETLLVTPAVRSLITDASALDPAFLSAALETGGTGTLRSGAAGLLREGLTTVDELWTALS